MVAVLVAPRTLARRCASCHDDLGRDAYVCRWCQTALHLDCRLELLRCPSLGCASEPLEPHVRLIEPGRGPRRRPSVGAVLEPILAHARWIAVGISLFSTTVLFGLAASDSWSPLVWLALAHALVLAPALAVLARRRSAGEGAGRTFWLPLVGTLALQIGAAPFAVAAGAIALATHAPLAVVLTFAGVVLEPIVAGTTLAQLTGAGAETRRPRFEA